MAAPGWWDPEDVSSFLDGLQSVGAVVRILISPTDYLDVKRFDDFVHSANNSLIRMGCMGRLRGIDLYCQGGFPKKALLAEGRDGRICAHAVPGVRGLHLGPPAGCSDRLCLIASVMEA